MTYIVKIKNNETGEIKVIEQDGDLDEYAEFLWTDGNFGCDCNLHYFFTDWDGTDCPCGENKYDVELINSGN